MHSVANSAQIRVNASRLKSDLERLGRFGRESTGGITRPAFSEADILARRWFAKRASDAGLQVRTDPFLNVIVELGPSDQPAVWTGSHVDTVPNGGMYDGAVGAIAALECLRRIREEGLSLERPLRAIAFQDEEGTFKSFLGSRGIAYGISAEEIERTTGPAGRRLVDAIASAGGDGQVATVSLGPAAVDSFVELHVEQGPVLEESDTAIGIVDHIVGVIRGVARFDGQADHAGTTPMRSRRDALQGAAVLINRLPELPARCGFPKAVATCGQVIVEPGVHNVVPGTAIVSLDLRDGTTEALEILENAVVSEMEASAARYGLKSEYQRLAITAPVMTDERVNRSIQAAANLFGLSVRRLPSGAGHDMQIMASLGPAGMIFIPSREGRSHSPLEFTSWVHIEEGANVLLHTLLSLASERDVVA